jgi:ribosomal protein S8
MSSVEIPFSKFVLRFIEFLYTKGLVTRFYIFRKKKKMFIHVVLGYFRNSGFLDGVKLKSIPSRVVVLTYKNIFYTVLLTSQFWGGLAIFSTKYGILDAHSCLKFRTGGVFLCFVPYVS